MQSLLYAILVTLLCDVLWWWISRRIVINKVVIKLLDVAVPCTIFIGLLWIFGLVRISYIPSTHPIRAGILATFQDDRGTNDAGEEWDNFNDNKFGGKSLAQWCVVKRLDRDDYYLRVELTIRKGRTDPYCGIYSFFSPHPVIGYDIRGWSGIQFDTKYSQADPSKKMRFFVQLATLNVHDLAYYEAEFTIPSSNDEWCQLSVPFAKFNQPYWKTTEKEPFDLSQFFKVAFYVRGDDEASGTLYLDDIRLFK